MLASRPSFSLTEMDKCQSHWRSCSFLWQRGVILPINSGVLYLVYCYTTLFIVPLIAPLIYVRYYPLVPYKQGQHLYLIICTTLHYALVHSLQNIYCPCRYCVGRYGATCTTVCQLCLIMDGYFVNDEELLFKTQ